MAERKKKKEVLNPAGLTPRQAHAVSQRKNRTPEQVYACAKLGATLEEAAGVLDVHKSTLGRRLKEDAYGEAWVRGQAQTRRAIREAQLEAAVKDRNPRMLIWLGKQYLGQKNHDVAPAPIAIEDSDKTISIRWDDELEKEYQEALSMDAEYEVADVTAVESESTDSEVDSDPEA